MEYRIKWTNFARASYIFGSQITFKGEDVLFDNPLMTPSFALTSWDSQTNFQGQRTQPALPLLIRGNKYSLQLVADVEPADTAYLKVTFYNRFGEEMSFETLKDQTWEFTYPEDAFSYRVELVNAGCNRVLFQELRLRQLLHDQDETALVDLEDLAVYDPKPHDSLHVLFLEPGTQSLDQLSMEVISRLGNIMFVGDSKAAAECYLSEEFEERLRRRLEFYQDNGLHYIRFIGYGPMGNLASLYYSAKEDSRAYYNKQFTTFEDFKQVSRYKPTLVAELLDRLRYAKNVFGYGPQARPNEENLELISGLFNTSTVLADLPIIENRGQ